MIDNLPLFERYNFIVAINRAEAEQKQRFGPKKRATRAAAEAAEAAQAEEANAAESPPATAENPPAKKAKRAAAELADMLPVPEGAFKAKRELS